MKNKNISNKIIFFSLAFLTFVFYWYGKEIASYLDSKWILKYPKHHAIPFAINTTSFVKWLINEASFGLFTFKELTRFFAWIIEQPYNLVLAIISKGIVKGQGQDAILLLGPLSWISVIGIFFTLALYTKDKFLIILVIFSIFYLAIFDQWQSSMITLSSIIIAVPIGVLLGIIFGILSYKSKILEKIITPILDLMQTVPVFAYLVPILVMFGFGPVSALIATIIYAMPPMVRTTILALNNIDPQLKESGIMSGCTDRQLMWKVLIPISKPTLLVGVNQVIMLSLNMVIIASMIGAGGLGYDVLASLRRLDIGGGIESGIAIVVLAIALDRLSQSFANLPSLKQKKQKNFIIKYKKILFRYTLAMVYIYNNFSWLVFWKI